MNAAGARPRIGWRPRPPAEPCWVATDLLGRPWTGPDPGRLIAGVALMDAALRPYLIDRGRDPQWGRVPAAWPGTRADGQPLGRPAHPSRGDRRR
jgi:hypothetical protein